MAEEQAQQQHVDEEDELTPGYKAPAEKSLKEINELDQDDEALNKYKRSLGVGGVDVPPKFPEDPRKVIVTRLSFCPADREEMHLDLTGDLEEVKKKSFHVKEGCKYKLKITFYVQREIVSGLRYNQKTYRKGIQVDKENYMVGSYAPKEEEQSYLSPEDEAPSGMLSRGSYKVKSLFTDDDKTKHLEWEWKLEIGKDWH